MEIAEINYVTDKKIEITGELDIDMSAECIHLGCYSERDSSDDWRDNAHISLKLFPHIRLSDLKKIFQWVSQNTGYRNIPWSLALNETTELGIESGNIVKVPYESNWKLTLERLD
jgi:hypothetical protein